MPNPTRAATAAATPTDRSNLSEETPINGTALKAVRYAGLALMAIVIAVFAAAVVVPRAFGGTALIITTGSMRPSMNTGDLIAIRPVAISQVQVGDVVTYATATDFITHRVVDLAEEDGRPGLILRGDANGNDDPIVFADQLRGRVMYQIPMVGHVIAWSRGNVPVAGALFATLISGIVTAWYFDKKHPDAEESSADAVSAEAEATPAPAPVAAPIPPAAGFPDPMVYPAPTFHQILNAQAPAPAFLGADAMRPSAPPLDYRATELELRAKELDLRERELELMRRELSLAQTRPDAPEARLF
jgi:signal peptidase